MQNICPKYKNIVHTLAKDSKVLLRAHISYCFPNQPYNSMVVLLWPLQNKN